MAINPEIRDQAYQFFIEEAPVLLQMIETALLTLKTERSIGKIHDLMRAAHSIKGGAASVELDAIAAIAHRLENIFKALYSDGLEIDTHLESQLLAAYDCLRLPLTEQITTGQIDTEQTQRLADSIFPQIEQALGNALTQADNYIISSCDLGINIALSIFEVDVAEGLNHLTAVLANPQNYEVAGELRAQAEVFNGFGMLLDLPGFSAIAQTALEALNTHPNRAIEITQLALADFQAGREAVLGGYDTQGGSPSPALLALAAGALPNPEQIQPQTTSGYANTPELRPAALSPPASQERSLENVDITIPRLEDVFGSAFATLETDLADSPTVAEIPQNVGQLLNQTSDRDHELEETWTSVPEEAVQYSQANTELPNSSELIDAELVAEAGFLVDAVPQELPTLEDVFGNTGETFELDASTSSAIVSMAADILPAITSDSLQQQQNLEETQDITKTIEAVVQPIEQRFESLPTLENTPEVVSGSFVDTPVTKEIGEKHQTTKQSATPKLTLRVELERLERMNNLVGELTINRNSLSLQNEQLQHSVQALVNRFTRFQKVVTQLQKVSDEMLVDVSVNSQWAEAAKPRPLNMKHFNPSYPQRYKMTSHRDAFLPWAATADATRIQKDSAVHYGNGNAQGDEQYPTTRQNQLPVDQSDFDTLEMDRYGVLHSRLQGILEEMAQLEEAVEDITLFAKATNQTLEQQRQMQIQLRDELMWARMLPLGEVLNRFPRLLRDLSTTYQKPVSLKLNGTGVLVDRAVLEKLYDPLVHLLRNAFDHGIEPPDIRQQLGKPEQGQIEISAYHKGNQTIIDVRDDGRGIQPELIRRRAAERGLFSEQELSKIDDSDVMQFIFEPGFSTADQVTELSGRGVGLDVLRAQVRSLKGTISLTSSPGVGTTFTLRLPLTLTIANLLICTVGSSSLAFPSESIEEIVVPKPGQTQQTGDKWFLHWREELIPVYRVIDLLEYSCPVSETSSSKVYVAVPSPEDWALPMLVLKQGQQVFALEVEHLIAEQELVIKPFGAAIAPPSYTYGCTILGDGSVIPVIDGVELVSYYLSEVASNQESTSEGTGEQENVTPEPRPAEVTPPYSLPSADTPQRQIHPHPTANQAKSVSSTILVVDDAVALRRTLALSLEKVGFRVLQARDGREAIEQLQKNLSTKLVICDVEMPNMNGFDFLNYRRQDTQLCQIPIMMLTSRSNNKHRWLAMHLGATAYFTKPYIEQTFIKAIKDIIANQESSR